jgi:hypothetical protein
VLLTELSHFLDTACAALSSPKHHLSVATITDQHHLSVWLSSSVAIHHCSSILVPYNPCEAKITLFFLHAPSYMVPLHLYLQAVAPNLQPTLSDDDEWQLPTNPLAMTTVLWVKTSYN